MIGIVAVAGMGALIVAAAQQAAGPSVALPADASATSPTRVPLRRDYGIEPILSSSAPAASSDAAQATPATPAAVGDAPQSTAPAASGAQAPASSAFVRLRLRDVGGAPVLFEPSDGALLQDPGAGGTNSYVPGDVFVDPSTGQQWVWVGNASVVSSLGVVSLESFAE
jgi:hypothetical protein